MPFGFVEALESRRLLSTGKILFIRGGSGSGGFYDGGTLAQRDEELADINNTSTATKNHGWGELAALLRGQGFTLDQVIEGANDTPVNLAAMNLSQYRLIVFGSNNATYDSTQVSAVKNYVFAGGSALFISDANFGSAWGDAPNSDQSFLSSFGLVMNQDHGTYTLSRANGDFLAPSHPILAGVNSFDGEGVSLGVKVTPASGVTAQVLVQGRDQTQDNSIFSSPGPDRDVTTNDGTLVVAAAGMGRVAIHFDRNTFFNLNGAGTSLHRFDNTQYAKNLFNWLTKNDSATPQLLAADFRYESAPLTIRFAFNADVSASLSLSDITLKNLTSGATIIPSGVSWDSTNNAAVFSLSGAPLADGNYRATIKAGSVSDNTGHSLAADANFDFYFLSADANRDRKVDMTDFATLASKFATTGRSFSQGNFDYSTDGKVDLTDFTFLASRFNQTLAPVAVASALPAAQPLSSVPILFANDELNLLT
jgi:hypothetical protein